MIMNSDTAHNNNQDSSLNVNQGVNQPPATNPNAKEIIRKRKRKQLSLDDYINGIQKGDRFILSQAITLIESTNPASREKAQKIIEACLPYSGKSKRIGITGVPGVGKSTFIEALGTYITSHDHNLAVLAIDPTSERSQGSILGDKTRMEALTTNPNAFIRPSATAGSLGGVANKTRESVILCEAAGYDTIFIETVGVGQSETAVQSMVDFFLLLMLADAGDELQGIKRGIMEMADAIIINKADGNNKEIANRARQEYKNALHLFPAKPSGWTPDVLTCSSKTKEGIEEIWNLTEKYFSHICNNGFFENNRKKQARNWMYENINDNLKQNFYNNTARKEKIKSLENKVLNGDISSFSAAKTLLNDYFNTQDSSAQ